MQCRVTTEDPSRDFQPGALFRFGWWNACAGVGLRLIYEADVNHATLQKQKQTRATSTSSGRRAAWASASTTDRALVRSNAGPRLPFYARHTCISTGGFRLHRKTIHIHTKQQQKQPTVGANITPYYDSLLIKITGKARNRRDVIMKLQRALKEFRVRCVRFILDWLAGWRYMSTQSCVCV